MTNSTTPLLAEHPTFNPSKVWVLLWSQQQKMLHIETLESMLANHREAFLRDIVTEYIPLVIGDEDVVERAADAIRPTMEARYEAWRAGDPAIPPYACIP